MYKHKQCLVALVCVLVAGKDCAGTLPRAAERFKTRLAAATASCQEAALIHEKNITATPAALEAQVARYGDSSLDVYIDGALLLWDLAHPVARTLSCAWPCGNQNFAAVPCS